MTTTSHLAGVAVALARLGARLVAELGQALWRPAVGDDALDRRQRRANRRDLRLRPASRSRARRGCAAPSRARYLPRHPLAAPVRSWPICVRLDHAGELSLLEIEEDDDERRPAGQATRRT